MNNIRKTLTITFLALIGLGSLKTELLAKEIGYIGDTPYRHMPIDTFVAGFPLEALVLLGLVSYIIGAVYIFNAVLLIKGKNK